MKECILHIGMHKTGSSAIQKFLNDKRNELGNITYALGENHSSMILLSFMENVEKHHTFKIQNLSAEELIRRKQKAHKLLEESISRTKQKLIISGEGLIFLNENELAALKEYLSNYFRKISVIAYIRPFESYISSAFSEMLKTTPLNVENFNIAPRYQNKFEKFENVFGEVKYRLYLKSKLISGDVIDDFIDFTDINISPESQRENIGLSFFAVKFLYQFQKFRNKTAINNDFIELISKELQKVESSKFQINPVWLEEYRTSFIDDIKWMECRVGEFSVSPQSDKKNTYDKSISLSESLKFNSFELAQLKEISNNDKLMDIFTKHSALSFDEFYLQITGSELGRKVDTEVHSSIINEDGFVKPNIHTYILCYNEDKILKNILDYYSEISTKIFLFDNISSDNSIKIASDYDIVKVIPFDTNGKKDNAKHVQIKSQAYKAFSRKGGEFTEEVADWIICVDTDEVIYTKNLFEKLNKYKKEGVTVPQITGFNMTGKNEIDRDVPIIEQYPRGVRSESFDKPVLFDVNFDMSYTKGCHPYGAGFQLMKETINYNSSNKYPIALLHYKDIGGLLYESAIKNHARFDSIKKDGEGRHYGAGSQYALYKQKGAGYSPFANKSKLVLDSSNNVLFSNFSRSKSDLGCKDLKTFDMPKQDINIIRDSALVAEKYDVSLALELMLLAKKYRPSGAGIIAKVDEYKKKLEIK